MPSSRIVVALIEVASAWQIWHHQNSGLKRQAAAVVEEQQVVQQHQNQKEGDDPLGKYDWREQWYPVGFAEEMPKYPEPASFSIFDEPIVLWRSKGQEKEFHCVEDRCPHRLAALSQGHVEPDGTIRCYYHGWAFNKDGKCTAMPQLSKDAQIPKTAHVKTYPTSVVEGIVWVWGTPDSLPTKDPPKTDDDLDQPDAKKIFDGYDFQIDLPYCHSFLVENLFDPAHVPISHDRTQGGGKREAAEAFAMQIDEDSISVDGFTGRYRGESKDRWTQAKFESPGIIRYRNELLDDQGKVKSMFSAALHCVPRGKGKCRLLFRTYFRKSGLPLILRLYLASQPKWKRHLNSCKVLEQDLGLITSQEDRNFTTFASECLPLKSSDTFVIAYREWLDRVKMGMPYEPVGWRTNAPAAATIADGDSSKVVPAVVDPDHRSRQPRLLRHVFISQTSRTALRNTVRLRNSALVAFLLSTASAAAATTAAIAQPLAAIGLLSAAVTAGSLKLEQAYYKNFDRHPWRPY